MKSLRLGKHVSSSAYICQSCQLYLYGIRSLSRKATLLPSWTKTDSQRKKETEAKEVDVRWFEESPSRDGKLMQVEGPEETETTQLKARIDRLEEELEEIRTGGKVGLSSFISQLAQAAREGSVEQEELQEALKDSSIAGDIKLLGRLTQSLLSGKDIASDGSEDISRSTVKMVTRKEQRIYLHRLNGYLKQAEALGFDVTTRKQLWRWYVRCKQSIPNFLSRVSSETLTTLWDSQADLTESNPDRSAHLKTIAEDTTACGYQLSLDQRVAYIEALFLEGETARAIESWRSTEKSLTESDNVEAFFELGVRMYAAHESPEEAHMIAYEQLIRGNIKDPRILITVINAWSQTKENLALRRAWYGYIRLKELLGLNTTMEDYDTVCKSFLDAGRADLALAVFKDMMLSADPSSINWTSPALFRNAVGTVEGMRSAAYDSPEINKISLEAMTILPRRYQNKFFYGSWIKKLLGQGDVDSAALVVELMMKRAIQPDAKYLNGMIGAWIREGHSDAYEKAEKMAWEMIEARKVFAWKRRASKRGQEPMQDEQSDAHGPIDSDVAMTPATLETFSLLIDYYLMRQNHDQIRWLNRSIGLAEIEPDTFFMNRLLQSYLKTDGLRRVWQTYTDWAYKRHCVAKPDMETFTFLWECARLRASRTPSWRSPDSNVQSINRSSAPSPALDQQIVRKELGFPSPRALFADMVNWMLSSSVKVRKTNADDFSKQVYDNIIRCFVDDGGGDLAGALVAMHAMKQHFDMRPDEDTAKILIRYIARSGEQSVTRRSVRHRPDRVVRVTQRLAELAQHRLEFLDSRGIDVGQCDERFREEENLFLASELVRSVIGRKKDPGELEHVVQRAAWDMGVGGIDTGDHLKSI
ncbi:MAG: hypothetical protein M1816_002083 [Peltula sp. TS41687]|nr:MAG: hypothetical protein M1816_002083 [Peltula sp. TS41687]